MSRPTWDDSFLAIAEIMSQRSTCSRRKVGAVLVQENRIIATGYNGAAPGEQHCIDGGCPRGFFSHDEVPPDFDYNAVPCVAIHAEANALIRAGYGAARGGTMYVTEKPCQQCTNLIKAAELKEVVVIDGTHHADQRVRRLPDDR